MDKFDLPHISKGYGAYLWEDTIDRHAAAVVAELDGQTESFSGPSTRGLELYRARDPRIPGMFDLADIGHGALIHHIRDQRATFEPVSETRPDVLLM